MAGEVSANISRSSYTHSTPHPPDRNKPSFITNETEFIGKGDIVRSSTPITSKHRRSRSRSGTRITPSALSLSDENFYEDLEEYVKEMAVVRGGDGLDTSQDVWSQLQQKESDLLLAAELGKALLEKNEELKKEQERVQEVVRLPSSLSHVTVAVGKIRVRGKIARQVH
ncbi:unnamed protein product [Chilo suppressalis]|uniref:HAP1 N-terminal domain-containing protein n=1 Tax=Chilo suppressalis TaxID=168631 RepID=A0ABN8B9C9_CHISP|nr:unnamed protein product [Chilo suppressalis]